ncbi:MAG TPA: sugar phosphate nucleotidyltransferase [Gaiellaceae bacterium]|nr:sugar phosphate nucleotidyltransferase [Gaiellaceae bacterium]
MRHAVILAGGSGTRLWPASRVYRPKQFLPLARDGEPLIAAAVAIARQIADRVVVMTAEAQVEATLAAVPEVEVIAEPVGRNTAAAIALAGATIAERDPQASIAILPADQHVRDAPGMVSALSAALTAAETTDAIALVGIPPSRPETGFGYLKIGAWGRHDLPLPVQRFVEKPDRATAEAYLADGGYLWNAGIFCLTAKRLFAELDVHLPLTASISRQIVRDNGLVVDPRGLYEQLPAVSFDNGVMEKTDRIVAVPAAVGWNDVGSWAAIPEVRGTDPDGNAIVGEGLVVGGSGNVVSSDDGTLVALVGVSDLVVVKSGDAILVVPRDQAQRVREVVDALKSKGLSRYL